MKKAMVSMMFVAGSMVTAVVPLKASAVFFPEEGPRSHTICREGNPQTSGLKVLLTGVEGQENQVRIDVYKISNIESQQIASQVSAQIRNQRTTTYIGQNFSLTIGNTAPASQELRTGQLFLILENGEELVRTLQCDALMHILGST